MEGGWVPRKPEPPKTTIRGGGIDWGFKSSASDRQQILLSATAAFGIETERRYILLRRT